MRATDTPPPEKAVNPSERWNQRRLTRQESRQALVNEASGNFYRIRAHFPVVVQEAFMLQVAFVVLAVNNEVQ